jgi:2-methylcitrate dehydratase PrpD
MVCATGQGDAVDFAHSLRLDHVPETVRRRLLLLLADMAAALEAGREAPVAKTALAYVRACHPGQDAVALADGSRVAAPGAAFANAALANALDYDDGHRLTKGHPGAIVIPAVLAVGQLVDAAPRDALEAVIVGYEVAIRAGIALHSRDCAYHASGAWGALGAAAGAARLLQLDRAQTLNALGLAEYHAPIAPVMRNCERPSMAKDACGWGAFLGVCCALLAARGFTCVAPELLESIPGDWGSRWCLSEVYVKAYPCCRWSQSTIAAALIASRAIGLPRLNAKIARVEVLTFSAAASLARILPADAEQAQYNLAWPVACAILHGRFGLDQVLGPWEDTDAGALLRRIQVVVDGDLEAQFPARRLSAVAIELEDGRRFEAGPVEAPGEPDDPAFSRIVGDKVAAVLDPARDLATCDRSLGMRSFGPAQLLGVLCDRETAGAWKPSANDCA